MNGESKRREFRSYHPKNGEDDDEEDWDGTLKQIPGKLVEIHCAKLQMKRFFSVERLDPRNNFKCYEAAK